MLILLCMAVPLWFGFRRSVFNNGVEVNHVTLFTFGFVFYWVLPIAAGEIANDLAGPSWSELFGSAFEFAPPYLLACFCFYLAFAAGDVFATRFIRPFPHARRPFNRPGLAIFLAAAVPGLAFTTFMYRDLLFRAYQVDESGDRARGTVAAFVAFLGVVALLYMSDHAHEKLRKLSANWFVFPFIAGSVLLLAIGSRLYVVSFFLMFVVYRSTFVKRIRAKAVMGGAVAIALLSGAVGVLRAGLGFVDVGANLLLEPMLTSFSLLYFLQFDHMAWIHFPKYLISDFTNLIPTALFPQKAELIQFPYVFNPVGAVHSFVSFNFNFGIIGTAIFMFALPIGIRWIRAHSALQLPRVSYAMLSGYLAFTFFRDPFSISLVKSMVQFALIVPAVVVAFNRLVQACAVFPVKKTAYPSS